MGDIFSNSDGIDVEIYVMFCSLCVIVQVGNYYLNHGGNENKCSYAPCRNADLGSKYVEGWTAKEDTKHLPPSCPTVRAHEASSSL